MSTHTQNETTAFRGKDPVTIKIIINDQALSEVSYFKFLGDDLPFDHHNDMKNKLRISKICVEQYEKNITDQQTQKYATQILNNTKKHYGSTNTKIFNSNSMRESLCLLYACETWTITIKRQRNTISRRSEGVDKRRSH
jgi:hypothetical protein